MGAAGKVWCSMCECGCTMMNVGYRLPGGKDFFYVVVVFPGCRNCVAPPGIIIRRINRGHWEREYLRHLPELPAFKVDGSVEYTIKCGLDPDEFAKAVCEQVKAGGFIGGGMLVEDAAHDLADLVWDEAIHQSPEAIELMAKASKARKG